MHNHPFAEAAQSEAPTFDHAHLYHDEEAEIWADLQAANKPDWSRWKDRALTVVVCAPVVALGMLAFFL